MRILWGGGEAFLIFVLEGAVLITCIGGSLRRWKDEAILALSRSFETVGVVDFRHHSFHRILIGRQSGVTRNVSPDTSSGKCDKREIIALSA